MALSKVFFFFLLITLLPACKKDLAGCSDATAINYNIEATINDGHCNYPFFIKYPGFERGDDWNLPYHPSVAPSFFTSAGDGFMPTEGSYYYKCLPDYRNTVIYQYASSPEHFKGFYFDYSYKCQANADSVIDANFLFQIQENVPNGKTTIWKKTLKSKGYFPGFPYLVIQKRGEYVPLDNMENPVKVTLNSYASTGTSTFCIDNIRPLP